MRSRRRLPDFGYFIQNRNENLVKISNTDKCSSPIGCGRWVNRYSWLKTILDLLVADGAHKYTRARHMLTSPQFIICDEHEPGRCRVDEAYEK